MNQEKKAGKAYMEHAVLRAKKYSSKEELYQSLKHWKQSQQSTKTQANQEPTAST